jgi:heterodisulfide reductase subunit A
MKIGVYICHCGINIAATVDIEKVTAFAQTLPHVAIARNYQYMCSDPGQDLIKNDIKNSGIDRVVVAACSPRMHENTYRNAVRSAGLNPYFFEMSNIREQCSWVHPNKEDGTKKAMELIASAVAKVSLHEPLEENEVSVTPSVLVIGGGIAGIQASLDMPIQALRSIWWRNLLPSVAILHKSIEPFPIWRRVPLSYCPKWRKWQIIL